MKRLLIFGILILLLVGTASAAVYGYGDSVTGYGFNYLIQMTERHNSSISVDYNTDGGGKNSSWALANISEHPTGYTPDDVYIMFGLNDRASMTGLQTATNLKSIYNYFLANGTTPHILINTLATPAEIGITYADQQSNITIIQNNLTEQGISFIKAYDAIDTVPGNGVPDEADETLLIDGVHPTYEGQYLIAEYVWYGTIPGDGYPFVEFYYPTGQSNGVVSAWEALYEYLRVNPGDIALTGDTDNIIGLYGGSSAGVYDVLARGEFMANTAPLPDDAFIRNVSFGVRVAAKYNALGSLSYGITNVTPTSGGVIVAGDYQRFNGTRLSTDVPYDNISTTNFTVFNGNDAFKALVSKTGWITIQLRDNADIDANEGLLTWKVGQANKSGINVIMGNMGNEYVPFFIVNYDISPTANFTSNVTSGTAPLAVQFNDTSTNAPTSWNWSFRNATGNNTEIWWSTLQNPEIALGVGNFSFHLNASNAYGFDITDDDYWINVTAPVPFTACKDIAGNLTINLSNVTNASLGFDWTRAYNITQLSFDAYFIDFDNSSHSYVFGGLQAETWHRIKIYNLTENGSMNCTTNATVIVPPPWAPDINPSTEKDLRVDTVFSKAIEYWWIFLLVAGAWILFSKR